MPPKRKTLAQNNQAPRRSSARLRNKMRNNATATTANEKVPIDLSTPTPPLENKKKRRVVTNKKPTSSCPEEQEKVDETPIRHHLIVTKEEDVKRFEEVDDCFILGFNPIEPLNQQNLSVANKAAETPDFTIVAEKGKVACRDYPHSRHLCIKFPFKTTPHEKYCELCYCYVCDTAAPCLSWSLSSANACLSHCNASENTANWKQERLLRKQLSAIFKE